MGIKLLFGGVDEEVHRFRCESIETAYRLMETIEKDYSITIKWWTMLRDL